jgi:hypothetical protein
MWSSETTHKSTALKMIAISYSGIIVTFYSLQTQVEINFNIKVLKILNVIYNSHDSCCSRCNTSVIRKLVGGTCSIDGRHTY